MEIAVSRIRVVPTQLPRLEADVIAVNPLPLVAQQLNDSRSRHVAVRDDLTDGRQVVHLLPTRDARDDAAEKADK